VSVGVVDRFVQTETDILMRTQAYRQTQTDTDTHTDTHTDRHTDTPTHIHKRTDTHTDIYTLTRAGTHQQTHTYRHTHTDTHIQRHQQTHISTHTDQVCPAAARRGAEQKGGSGREETDCLGEEDEGVEVGAQGFDRLVFVLRLLGWTTKTLSIVLDLWVGPQRHSIVDGLDHKDTLDRGWVGPQGYLIFGLDHKDTLDRGWVGPQRHWTGDPPTT